MELTISIVFLVVALLAILGWVRTLFLLKEDPDFLQYDNLNRYEWILAVSYAVVSVAFCYGGFQTLLFFIPDYHENEEGFGWRSSLSLMLGVWIGVWIFFMTVPSWFRHNMDKKDSIK